MVSKIQIVTDSIIDVPRDIRDKYHIKVIPLKMHFGEEEYRDGVDLTYSEFYKKLSEAKDLPKTSQVTPSEFVEVFKQGLAEGKEILCINGSSRASGTHQSAIIAKNELGGDKIEVFDTMNLCLGGGMYVYEAAKMVENGATMQEILEQLNILKLKIDGVFTVETLEFLKKGGRLKPMKAIIANILNIRPILTIADGLVETLDKARGSKKVSNKIMKLAKQRGGDFTDKTIGLAVAAPTPERIEALKQVIVAELNPKEIIVAEVGCIVGTHAGPGTWGLFYIR